MPALEAYLKPRSLNESSTCETTGAPYATTSSETIALMSFFFSEALLNSNVLGLNSPSSASERARSIVSLKMIRPPVVRKWQRPPPRSPACSLRLQPAVLVDEFCLLRGGEHLPRTGAVLAPARLEG